MSAFLVGYREFFYCKVLQTTKEQSRRVLEISPAVGRGVRTSEFLVLTPLGRFLRLAGFARLKNEVRDRTLARTGPHSR